MKRHLRTALFTGIGVGLLVAIYVAAVAQQMGLDQRIARLKSEVGKTPTTAANFKERTQTLEAWGNRMATDGKLRVPQDLMVAFVRNSSLNDASEAQIQIWTRKLTFLEQNSAKTGRLTRTDKNKIVAGAYSTAVLEYTVGDIEIPTGGMIRLGQIFISNRPRMQALDPGADQYVTFKVEGGTAKGETTFSRWNGVFGSIFGAPPSPAFKVTSGSLKKGDKVILTIGDTSGGGTKGYRPAPRDADDYKFLVEADFKGDGFFNEAAITSTRILGDYAADINAVAPSVVGTNETFALRLRIEDQYGNPAQFDGGSFGVYLNNQQVGKIDVAADRYLGSVEGLKIAAEGAYKFQVKSVDGRFRCVSNPVLVERNPKQRVYWGELHAHSGWEEGTGSVPRYYEYARDVAFLDFASLTGHDAFLADPGWAQIRAETEKANRPGSFVAYSGIRMDPNL